MIKTCSRCHKEKDQEKWHGRQCKECLHDYRCEWRSRSRVWLRDYRRDHSRSRDIERATKWNVDNAAKHREHCLDYYYRLQDEAVRAYGGYACACCGETEPLFLTLDHVNNDGGKFRRETGFLHHGAKFYKWLKDHFFPPGYQVLCSNCNHGKHRNNGTCPHQRA